MFSSNDDMNSLVGKMLGQFRIVERIGAGGMATVFKAYQQVLDRYVAIKVFPDYHARDPKFKERFLREARAVARLDHPNIVQIYLFGEEENITYIVMQYVDGGTLKDKLRTTGALSPADAIKFVVQAAEGLGAAHKHGIIHRDVKPANMLLRKNGHLLLSDFGIMKILEGTTNLTRVGTGIGTPQYMSPEEATGQAVDASSDIYSLGIVFFHCLTGRVPFNADSPLSITVKHLNEPLPVTFLRQVNVPPPIEQIIVKMTAKMPADRYPNIGEVINELTISTSRIHLTTDAGSQNRNMVSPAPITHISANAPRNAPSAQSTLAILLGASEWPYFREFQSSKAFSNSASHLKAYLLNPRQFGLPSENVLDLFDVDQSADDIDRLICNFLDQHASQTKASGNAVKDLLVYYVGHGGFVGSSADYYLAIRRTRSDNPRASSIGIASLADMLKGKARRLRRTLILDCCFAAAAFQSFQSGPGQVAIQQAIEAFKEKGEGTGYPERGTTLLCSSGPKVPSLISQDGSYTMFTKALLEALTKGNPRQQDKPYLSLRELNTLTADFLADSSGGNAPRPYLHSPDQSEGDVADVPLFPNFSAKLLQGNVTCPWCNARLAQGSVFCGRCGMRQN